MMKATTKFNLLAILGLACFVATAAALLWISLYIGL